MNLELRKEIEDLTGQKVLDTLRSKNKKPEKQAELGMKFMKTVSSIETERVSVVIQAAGLFTPQNREEIAKKIISPMSLVIDPNIKLVNEVDIKNLFDTLQQTKQEKEAAMQETKQVMEEKTKIENRLADILDDQKNKEMPAIIEAAQEEYRAKREY